MTQSSGTKTTQHTATEPIINVIDPVNAGNISWEVKDDSSQSQDLENKNEDPKPEVNNSEEKESEDSSPDESFEPEEVEDKKEAESEEEEEKPRKKTNKVSPDRRIAELNRQKKQWEAVAKDALNQKENLERQLTQKSQEKIVADENLLKTHMENIERAHALALEEGDYDKAAKAATLMAQYSARLESTTQQKYQLPQYSEPKRQQNYEQPAIPEYNEEFQRNGKNWIQQNPWADPNSDNYNPKLLQRADEYVEELMDLYTFEGRAVEIGKPEFFSEITQHIEDSFNISRPSKPQKERLVMNSKGVPNVAPVNRSATVSNVQRSKQDINLTPEQISMAHAMSGVIKVNGQRVTDRNQLESLYKKNLMKQMGRG